MYLFFDGSRDLVDAREFWEMRGNEKVGMRQPFVFQVPRRVYAVIRASKFRAAAVPVAPPLGIGGFSSLKLSTTTKKIT